MVAIELSGFDIFLIILLIIILSELLSWKLIKYTFIYKKQFLKPHIFLNFISNDKYNDQQVQISSDGFRQINFYLEIEKENFYNLYLMGDCEFFEGHLPNKETFAYKLKQNFSNITILNPSMVHYTHYHMLNRLIYDIKNSKKIDFVLSSATVNDALVYIHHKGSADGVPHHVAKVQSNNIRCRHRLLCCWHRRVGLCPLLWPPQTCLRSLRH